MLSSSWNSGFVNVWQSIYIHSWFEHDAGWTDRVRMLIWFEGERGQYHNVKCRSRQAKQEIQTMSLYKESEWFMFIPELTTVVFDAKQCKFTLRQHMHPVKIDSSSKMKRHHKIDAMLTKGGRDLYFRPVKHVYKCHHDMENISCYIQVQKI